MHSCRYLISLLQLEMVIDLRFIMFLQFTCSVSRWCCLITGEVSIPSRILNWKTHVLWLIFCNSVPVFMTRTSSRDVDWPTPSPPTSSSQSRGSLSTNYCLRWTRARTLTHTLSDHKSDNIINQHRIFVNEVVFFNFHSVTPLLHI